MSRLYESESQIEQIVRGFEACETPPADFHHREHLVVAVWYLQTLSTADAVARMRTALLRFLDHHGEDRKIYSEEITVFWVDAVATHLGEIGAQASLLQKCNQVIGALGNSKARTPAVDSIARSQLNSSNVRGQLQSSDVSGQLESSNVSGQLQSSDVSGQLESSDVSGQLDSSQTNISS